MQLTGLLWGGKLLEKVEFPIAEVLGPEASVDDRDVEDAELVRASVDRHGVDRLDRVTALVAANHSMSP